MKWSAHLPGRVISKKNSKQIYRTAGRTFVSTSDAYKTWHEEAMWRLYTSRPKVPLSGALSITLTFWMKGKIDADWDNLSASICDLLTDLGVIEDDKQIVLATVRKNRGDEDFATDIEVEQI